MRVLLVAVAASLMLCGLVASAGAVTVDANGGPVAVGSSILGTASQATFTSALKTIKCDVTVSGTVTANPDASGNVAGEIDKMHFTNCTNPNPCTIADAGPFTRSAGGGMLVSSTTAAEMGVGSGSIDISGCVGFTCLVKGGTASGTFGADTITNYVAGTTAAGSDTVTLNAAPVSAVNCIGLSGASWDATFTLETSAGSPVTVT